MNKNPLFDEGTPGLVVLLEFGEITFVLLLVGEPVSVAEGTVPAGVALSLKLNFTSAGAVLNVSFVPSPAWYPSLDSQTRTVSSFLRAVQYESPAPMEVTSFNPWTMTGVLDG